MVKIVLFYGRHHRPFSLEVSNRKKPKSNNLSPHIIIEKTAFVT